MKLLTSTLIAVTLLSTLSIPDNKNTISGVLYSDESFISITTENGKILAVKKSDPPENASKVYVAPGLVDVQINGYMGVDFSGPDLTVEGVK